MATFTYSTDFNALWAMLLGPAPPGFPLTIIWDKTPTDPNVSSVMTSEFLLTAVHWAACARIQWKSADIGLEVSRSLASRPHFERHLILGLSPSARPWLKLSTDPMGAVSHCAVTLEEQDLQHLLRSEITSGKIHHPVNNLLIPLILNGMPAVPTAGPPSHAFALAVMLRIIGMTVDEGVRTTALTPLNSGLRTVTLVDDQAHHGWETWVKTLLLGTTVQTKSPIEFWRLVQAQLTQQTPVWADDAILLDLRLGSELEGKVEAHFRQHSAHCLGLAHELGADIEAALKSDLQSLERQYKAESSGADETTLAAMDKANEPIRVTLLARLVAMTLPRTPVVIFSSTQQREIIGRLSIFGNVITSFTKGTVVQASLPGFPEGRRKAFGRAMEQSVGILRVSDLAQACEEASRSYTTARQTQTITRSQAAHVELYIDESGEKAMKVGGVVAIFQSGNIDDALENAHQFNRTCLSSYFCPFSWGALHPLGWKDFPTKLADALQKEAPIAPILSRIELTTSGDNETFLRKLRGDRRHRDMVMALIDLFVSVVLPEIKSFLQCDNISVSVFGGSRVLPPNKMKNGAALPYKMGFGYMGTWDKPGVLYLLGNEDIGQFAFEALERFHPRANNDFVPRQLLTVVLAYDPGVDANHKRGTPVRFSVNHKTERRSQESTQAGQADWEPDCRALHYVGDKSLGREVTIPLKLWSIDDDFDKLPIDQLLDAAEKMPRRNPSMSELAAALLLLEKDHVQRNNGVARLLAVDLIRLAGGRWKQVVAAAFRQAVQSANV
jgi:hypothetical protein